MMARNGIVKEFLDTNLGKVTRIQDLSNARTIYQQLLERKDELEQQLSVITTEVPTKIEGAIRSADISLARGETLITQKDLLMEKIGECMNACTPIADDLYGTVIQVKEIEKYVLYLQWLEYIGELSGEVQQSILSGSLTTACRKFKRMLEVDKALVTHQSKCESLIKFSSDSILFWHNILKEKLAGELEQHLKIISWPFVLAPGPKSIPKSMPPSGEKLAGTGSTTSTDLPADFERIFNNLLLLELPDHLKEKQESENGISADQVPVSNVLIPLQLMLKPLRKRFRYHFSGKKQTNLISKPEWYLTQVLNWVGNHREFLECTVQPILDKAGYSNVDALIMFTRGLLLLVCWKLSEDMDELLLNDDMFSHTVDEVLLFDRELRGSHDFPLRAFINESPLSVFMQPECLQKWINVEQICALDRLDSMLSSPNAWESQYGDQVHFEEDAMVAENTVDDVKVPECAESFVTMLLTITDRYKHIPSSTYQLRFLDLQLHLLDDFRIRLTQVLKREVSDDPLGQRHFAVLNAAHYVANVLREWAENLFFLELKHKRDEENGISFGSSEVVPQSLLKLSEGRPGRTIEDPVGSGADGSVFDAMLKLYDRLYKDGLDQVSGMVCSEFEAKGKQYTTDSWLTLPPKEEQLTFVVSRTACSMLLVLQERLHLLSQRLCTPLFSSCWHCLADKVDVYLYREVVQRNHFNVGGAAQLQFDMSRNLFPMFGSYTTKPENYFRRMKESCILLNLQAGSALLLYEVLTSNSEPEFGDVTNRDDALTDMGVTLLQAKDALAVLKLRVDWPQNR